MVLTIHGIMGDKLPEKTAENVGKEEKCPNCNEKITLGVKKGSGGYADKIQWQGKDGKAHYGWDGHNVSCVILEPKGDSGETGEPPDPNANQPSSEQIKKEAKENQKPVMDQVEWRAGV